MVLSYRTLDQVVNKQLKYISHSLKGREVQHRRKDPQQYYTLFLKVVHNYGVIFEYMYIVDNDQITVISISITSNTCDFFVLGTSKILSSLHGGVEL